MREFCVNTTLDCRLTVSRIGLFQSTYEKTTLKSYTPSDISWIFAVQLALMWAPGPFFGRIIDTYGPAPILYPCSFLCVFSLCMTSLSNSYYQIFLAQGIGFGLGAGGCFTTGVVCCGQWFVKRRGLGIGIASSASGLGRIFPLFELRVEAKLSAVGGVIFPIFFSRIMGIVGFNGALRYTALFIGILLAISCFFVTARVPRRKWNKDMKWVDIYLFKQTHIALYCFGSFLCMLVSIFHAHVNRS